jgi:ribosome-associated translation inhibitor RaiA
MRRLTLSIAHRRARQEFIARGLASAALARKRGKYFSADTVIKKLEKRLVKAKPRLGE